MVNVMNSFGWVVLMLMGIFAAVMVFFMPLERYQLAYKKYAADGGEAKWPRPVFVGTPLGFLALTILAYSMIFTVPEIKEHTNSIKEGRVGNYYVAYLGERPSFEKVQRLLASPANPPADCQNIVLVEWYEYADNGRTHFVSKSWQKGLKEKGILKSLPFKNKGDNS